MYRSSCTANYPDQSMNNIYIYIYQQYFMIYDADALKHVGLLTLYIVVHLLIWIIT